MLDKIENIKSEAALQAEKIDSPVSLENFRLKYLSRNGLLNELFEEMKGVDKSQKGPVGKALNGLKNSLQNAFDEKKSLFDTVEKKIPSLMISLFRVKNLMSVQNILLIRLSMI